MGAWRTDLSHKDRTARFAADFAKNIGDLDVTSGDNTNTAY